MTLLEYVFEPPPDPELLLDPELLPELEPLLELLLVLEPPFELDSELLLAPDEVLDATLSEDCDEELPADGVTALLAFSAVATAAATPLADALCCCCASSASFWSCSWTAASRLLKYSCASLTWVV